MVELPMACTDMADHLGLTIEAACRILAHLRHDGIITVGRSGIELCDRISLELIASELRH
jgi:CRP-like cAMP-binding protein